MSAFYLFVNPFLVKSPIFSSSESSASEGEESEPISAASSFGYIVPNSSKSFF
jgi:hypothetical protein